MTLSFLSGNVVQFYTRAEDDWYRAIVPATNIQRGDFTSAKVWYYPDEAASPLGCFEQYQWCRDPSQGQYGKLAGQVDALRSAVQAWVPSYMGIPDTERPKSRRRRRWPWIIRALIRELIGPSQYAYLEWRGETAIQLHRVAQDQLGHGEWRQCDENIPITRPDDLLAPFDITDPKHPVLAHEKASVEDAPPREAWPRYAR
ncbi:Cation diffusion facilitator family metal ion [Apiospora saccharicola]|uniref:Cation diffusion facilitator family metal ion n=1 Tax=Apiospora saccharicola TaxID=335842 RepID=A0ABR1TKR4_9PEZI